MATEKQGIAMKITVPEQRALRLLRLVSSPGDRSWTQTFRGERDASGNSYLSLFESLKAKGMLQIEGNSLVFDRKKLSEFRV